MQTCSRCNIQSSDMVTICPNCGADLKEYSTTAVSLKKLQENPRVRDIRLVVAADACPACRALEGTYAKESVPSLPILGCSAQNGCNCLYEPMLTEIFP